MSSAGQEREQELAELLKEVRALRKTIDELKAAETAFPPDYAVLVRSRPALPPDYAVLVRSRTALPPDYAVLVRPQFVQAPSDEELVRSNAPEVEDPATGE